MEQLSIKKYFDSKAVQEKFKELLGAKATGFVTSVLQVVNSNKALADADPQSVYGAAAAAAVLDLPINNNLGFAYIIAYNERQQDGSYKQVAQFQLGYKGFVQLAQRSGQFQTISAAAIYDGQLKETNPLLGYVFDFNAKKSDTVIGYAAYFRLLNGFEKVHYMDIKELEAHAKRFSKTFSKDSSLWKKDFDAMAKKTVIKLLLSRFAPLSIEMQTAVIADQAKINNLDTQDVTYIDNTEDDPINRELERTQLLIEEATELSHLTTELWEQANTYGLIQLFNEKRKALGGE